MRKLITMLFLFTAATAFAGTKGGVSLPDETQVAGKTLVLNGMGIREATVFNVKVYVAGLYLPAKSTDASAILGQDQPWRLTSKFVRDVDREKMVDAWKEGFEKTGDEKALGDRISKLTGFMQDLHEGDTMTYTYVPGQGTTVEINGSAKGTIPGADFAHALLSIWLGPNPPNASLKAGLLGG
jgi:hypothetical protein